jgi:hypothetical protein
MGPSKFEALIDGAFAIALTGWGATPPHKCTDGPVLAGGGPTEFDHVTPAQSQTPIGCRRRPVEPTLKSAIQCIALGISKAPEAPPSSGDRARRTAFMTAQHRSEKAQATNS